MTLDTLSFASGMHQHNLDVDGKQELQINLNEHASGTLIIMAHGSGNLKLDINVGDGSDWTILWLNRSDQSLNIKETIEIGSNVNLIANYGELTEGEHHKETLAKMVGTDSHLHLRGASIIFKEMTWKVTALHLAKRTFANLDNHMIVLENGKLVMEVTGSIENGHSGSETHQMTRVMNLGETVNATVYPKLLISENDVAASHAAAVGQPDEEHIYYLQSRGVTRLEALKLITKGYLYPITENIEDETIKNQLLEEIEMKVDTQWTEL